MHKIDSPNATEDNEFTDGDEASGILATELWAKWFNTIQRELVAVCEAAGLTLDDADDEQIVQALKNILTGFVGQQIKQLVLDIGPWDMNTTGAVDIETGLDVTKIIGIREVQVISDNGVSDGRHPLNMASDWSETPEIMGGFYMDGTEAHLWRSDDGWFASQTIWNNSANNRGYLVVDYFA